MLTVDEASRTAERYWQKFDLKPNIIFNTSSLRWELIPKKNSKRIIKVSHTDYYGLVWLRDIVIEKYSLPHKKSIFNFNILLYRINERMLLKTDSGIKFLLYGFLISLFVFINKL